MYMTLRPLFAWALLAYAGAELFFIATNWWLPGSGGNLFERSLRVDTTTLTTVGLPILALLLTAWVKPALAMAKTVALVALAEYLIILLFGGLTFALGLAQLFDVAHGPEGALAIFSHVVFAFLGFAIAAMCALVCWRYYSSREDFTSAAP